MLRPSSLPHARAALGAAIGAGVGVLMLVSAGLVTAAPAAATQAPTALRDVAAVTRGAARAGAPSQPLVPKIRSISPDYVPDKGPIVITGTVTNDSHRTWTAINVHGFMGSSPITTAAELAAAVQTPLTADVGHRITKPGTFASIAALAPGASARFRVRLPHDTLPLAGPGVYWFGVHVLGDDGSGGPREAVGRDRTFLSYVPKSAVHGQQENAALVVPVRSAVTHGPDGTVVDPETWGRSLRAGTLHDLVETGSAASGQPLTWLVDPAVPDVVRRLARGNPKRTLAIQVKGDQDGPSSSASPSDSATGAGGSGSGSGASGTSGSTPSSTTRQSAKAWLGSMHSLLGQDSQEVLGLPYGDLAVEPAVEHDLTLLKAAFRRSSQAMSAWGLPESPAIAPPDGRTTGAAVTALPDTTDVLLPDTGVSRSTHTVNGLDGHRLLLESSATTAGGPGPVNPHGPLAFRQRVLADAALRVLQGRQPLVVELPAGVRHRIRPSFFTGLDVPWLRLTTLDDVTSGKPAALDADQLRAVPTGQPTLGPRLYSSADDIVARGDTLQSVLGRGHALQRQLFDEVAGNASYAAEREPYIALARMRVVDRWVSGSLSEIDLAAPESVTLASASGHFSVLLSNGLDVPVTVQVHAAADPRVRITGGTTVELPANGRASVLLSATTHQRGVHNVRLELTSPNGRPLGASDPFPMRAEQVSGLIWVIIGAGVLLLFAAIAVRLTRRILRARAS
ncbi:MAG TPA: DUF6049 family protein [Nocardioides sp.]|uniref:DUF6049 family protein n=1 Tax=Nocardioides sp. TaxID=35761 RepID=UPI002E357345|nr:DUF6049 family protein [Nocardioides sp.]HEX3930334.1 DUF6049 family protein [Nocardioides sp.]